MKTVSLELSKQLKEAGYPQSRVVNHFYYAKVEGFDWYYHFLRKDLDNVKSSDPIASPTSDEILEQLPDAIEKIEACLNIWKRAISNEDWSIRYTKMNALVVVEHVADSLADAAARMWLYLKKEGLL